MLLRDLIRNLATLQKQVVLLQAELESQKCRAKTELDQQNFVKDLAEKFQEAMKAQFQQDITNMGDQISQLVGGFNELATEMNDIRETFDSVVGSEENKEETTVAEVEERLSELPVLEDLKEDTDQTALPSDDLQDKWVLGNFPVHEDSEDVIAHDDVAALAGQDDDTAVAKKGKKRNRKNKPLGRSVALPESKGPVSDEESSPQPRRSSRRID